MKHILTKMNIPVIYILLDFTEQIEILIDFKVDSYLIFLECLQIISFSVKISSVRSLPYNMSKLI